MKFIKLISGFPVSLIAFFILWPSSGEPVVGGYITGVAIVIVFFLGLPWNFIISAFLYLLLFLITDLIRNKIYFSNLYAFIIDPNMYLAYFPLIILLLAIHINSSLLINFIMLKYKINRA